MRLDLAVVLRSQLPWPEGADLDRLAPSHWKTPAGRQVAIDYSGDVPVLAVRVQQLYGSTAHPTVADGRVPLQLQLLSPADRPIQITSDLPGFWTGSWAEVRKDMAGRYPKHDWPLDPRSPTSSEVPLSIGRIGLRHDGVGRITAPAREVRSTP